jgi:membrane protein required for colicin V production
MAVAAGIVFFVTLVVVSLATVRLSDAILDSKVGALDRSLGFVFGAVRGLLLCVVAFVFFGWLVPDKSQPEWVRTARMKPILQATGDQLMAMLPDDPEGLLNKLKKKGGAVSEEQPAEGDDTRPAIPTPPPKPVPGRRT